MRISPNPLESLFFLAKISRLVKKARIYAILLGVESRKVAKIYRNYAMKKVGLVEAVMKAAGIETKKQAEMAVEAVFDTIVKTLSKGEEVAITGFGTFRVAKRAARMGVNPKTGEKIQIAASTKPKFRAGKLLKEAVL